MDFKRFSEIWDERVTKRLASKKSYSFTDRMSDATIDALVAASDGIFTVFDEIDKKLKELDDAIEKKMDENLKMPETSAKVRMMIFFDGDNFKNILGQPAPAFGISVKRPQNDEEFAALLEEIAKFMRAPKVENKDIL